MGLSSIPKRLGRAKEILASALPAEADFASDCSVAFLVPLPGPEGGLAVRSRFVNSWQNLDFVGSRIRKLSSVLDAFSWPVFHLVQLPAVHETSIGATADFNMGSGKKEAARKERQGKGGDGLDNVKVKGENFYRYTFEVSWRPELFLIG